MTVEGHGIPLQGWNVLELDNGNGCTTLSILNFHQWQFWLCVSYQSKKKKAKQVKNKQKTKTKSPE